MTGPFSKSALDSQRFGIAIFRGRVEQESDLREVTRLGEQGEADMVIVRVDAARTPWAQALGAGGALLCDTLVYWSCAAERFAVPDQATEGIAIRLADASDAVALEALIRSSFTDFGGHYHSDLRLPSAAATEGYVEWGLNLLERGATFVAEQNGKLIGFLSATLTLEDRVGEIVLNGVAPEGRQQGVYRSLVAAAGLELLRRGARTVASSTQVGNIAPQRVWARCGLLPVRAEHTFHHWYR